MKSMPLVFYPTILLWVDDDKLLLQAASEGFKRSYHVKTYTSPQACLEFFQQYRPCIGSVPFLHGEEQHENYDLSDHLPVDINLKATYGLLTNHQRGQDIAVMIVDYHMPDMSGIELCRKLSDRPIKKILLTGEANHQIAVNAFNEGVIDAFIRKDDPSLVSDLKLYIERLGEQFFTELTCPLLAHLEADYKLPQSDPAFIELFNEWRQVNQIREYYLIDKNGSLLTIDTQGKRRFFVIHTNRTLNLFSELHNEDKRSHFFVRWVEERNKVPFFGIGKEAWDFNCNDWNEHFYSPQILDGRERYWWVVVEDELTKSNYSVSA